MDSSSHRVVTRLLQRQVLECGHRASGTAGSRRLVRFLTTYLKELGLLPEIEDYSIRTTRPHRAMVEVSGHVFRALPYLGSPAFLNYPQQHDIRAPLEWLSQGANGRLRDKIVLCEVAEQKWPSLLGHCQESRCSGVILITTAESDDRILAPVSPFIMSGLDTVVPHLGMPILGVSQAAGRALRAHAERGERARLDVIVETENARAQNVRVRTGTRTSAPIWVVCHHDSAHESPDIPAANDNASGVAALGETLRLLTEEQRLREDVEIIFYDAEEYSLYGCLSLLVDLQGLMAESPFDSLYETLHDHPIEPRWRRPLPEILIEIDTVGLGRELHYGASHPERVARLLEAHSLGTEFDKVYLNCSRGSVGVMAEVIGVGEQIDFHSLTLGNAELAHTPLDDLSRISVDDVCRVSRFLRDLLKTVDATWRHTDTSESRIMFS